MDIRQQRQNAPVSKYNCTAACHVTERYWISELRRSFSILKNTEFLKMAASRLSNVGSHFPTKPTERVSPTPSPEDGNRFSFLNFVILKVRQHQGNWQPKFPRKVIDLKQATGFQFSRRTLRKLTFD
jgi:hypothetical protein